EMAVEAKRHPGLEPRGLAFLQKRQIIPERHLCIRGCRPTRILHPPKLRRQREHELELVSRLGTVKEIPEGPFGLLEECRAFGLRRIAWPCLVGHVRYKRPP